MDNNLPPVPTEQVELDIPTWNQAIKIIWDEFMTYPPGSPEAVAILKLKEKFDSV